MFCYGRYILHVYMLVWLKSRIHFLYAVAEPRFGKGRGRTPLFFKKEGVRPLFLAKIGAKIDKLSTKGKNPRLNPTLCMCWELKASSNIISYVFFVYCMINFHINKL